MCTESMPYHWVLPRRSENARQTRYKTGQGLLLERAGAAKTSVSAVCYKMQLDAIVRFTFVSRCASSLFMYISAWLAGLFSWVRCSSMLSLGADSMWIIHYVSFVKVQSHGTKYVCFGWASYPVDVAFWSAVATTSDKHTNTHLSLFLSLSPSPHLPHSNNRELVNVNKTLINCQLVRTTVAPTFIKK